MCPEIVRVRRWGICQSAFYSFHTRHTWGVGNEIRIGILFSVGTFRRRKQTVLCFDCFLIHPVFGNAVLLGWGFVEKRRECWCFKFV